MLLGGLASLALGEVRLRAPVQVPRTHVDARTRLDWVLARSIHVTRTVAYTGLVLPETVPRRRDLVRRHLARPNQHERSADRPKSYGSPTSVTGPLSQLSHPLSRTWVRRCTVEASRLLRSHCREHEQEAQVAMRGLAAS